MITKIAPNAPPSVAETKLDAAAAHVKAKDATDPKIAHVAEQFEEVFLRQLLAASKIGGKEEGGGYGSMAVDALATGISRGGGFGIAKQIEAALSHSMGSAHVAKSQKDE